MSDDPHDVLKLIREETEKHLRNGVTIMDVVYRPFDMGVFGRRGYSLVLYKAPDEVTGILFKEPPSMARVVAAVEELLTKLELREVLDYTRGAR